MTLNQPSNRNPLAILGALCVLLLLSACDKDSRGPQVSGETMGTSYSMQWHSEDESLHIKTIRLAAEKRLVEINQLMSTYIPDSQLSLYNAQDHSGWFAANPELISVLDDAYNVSQASNGAFDITIGPLVNLWGFGPKLEGFSFPSETEVRIAKLTLGWDRIRTQQQPPAIFKPAENIYVDLSAIAKGYAVDQLALLLENFGIENYMVEIGGEIKASGIAEHGAAWRIGIETPMHAGRGMEAVIALNNLGVATSGDYRNYFEHEGKSYSHTIDPRTGYPVKHNLASVTVLHESTTVADAWATALLVLGPQEAYAYAEENDLAILLITREEHGYVKTFSSRMRPFVLN